MPRVFLPIFALGAAILVAAGCSQQPSLDPAVVAEHRSRLMLADEPDGARTVLEVRQVMFGDEAVEGHDHDHEGEERAHDHEHDEDAEHAEHDEAAHVADAGDDPEPAEGEHADHGDKEPAAGDASDAEEEEHADHEHAEDADHEHAEDEYVDDDHAHDEHADHAHDAGDDTETASKTPVISELDVVLVGAVGGVPNPSEQSHPEFPFAKGKAVFFLADPEAVAEMEEHQHKHAPGEECAFCAAHGGDATDMLAVVQFADEQGKLLPVDARELFELKEKETVVVRGKAKIDPSGMLIVDATGLYVRR